MTDVPFAFFGNLGPGELVIVGIIALLLFGKRLPEVARSLGQSWNSFQRGLREVETMPEPAGRLDVRETVHHGS